MKNFKKMLSVLLTAVLVVGVVLSVPYVVTAEDDIVWGDYYAPGNSDGTKSSYVTFGPTTGINTSQHAYTDTNGYAVGYVGNITDNKTFNMIKYARDNGCTSEIPDFYDGQVFSNESTGTDGINTAYDLFPTLTYYVYAQTAGDYKMQFRSNSDGTYITSQTILVNDRRVYQVEVSGAHKIFEKTITLVKGYNFIRFYLVDDNVYIPDDYSSGAWANLSWVRFESSLVPIASTQGEYKSIIWSKNWNGGARIGVSDDGTSTKFLGTLDETQAVSNGTSKYDSKWTEDATTITKDLLISACNYVDGSNTWGTAYYVGSVTDTTVYKNSYVPFASYTFYVQESGYYNIIGSASTGGNKYFKGRSVVYVDATRYIINTSKIGTLTNGFGDSTNKTNAGTYKFSLSVYIPAGQHTFTFTAPFNYQLLSGSTPWYNFGDFTIYLPGNSKDCASDGSDYESLKTQYPLVFPSDTERKNQTPSSQTNDASEPNVAIDGPTTYIWADTSGVFNSQTYRTYTGELNSSNGSFTDQGFWQIANGNGKKYNTSTGAVTDSIGIQYAFTDTAASTEHYIVGNLASISNYTDAMQSWRSIAEERYINKSYLPIVTYQVTVDEEGVYDIDDLYTISLKTGFSYDDYYQVISVNDTQFLRADFVDFKDAGYGYSCGGVHNRDADENYDSSNPQYDPRGSSNTVDNQNDQPTTSHRGVSSFKAHLSKGVNFIRCIVAVQETAEIVGWCNMSCLKVSNGPGTVTGLEVPKNTDGTQNDPAAYKYSFKQADPLEDSDGTHNAEGAQTTASNLPEASNFVISSDGTVPSTYDNYAINVRNYGNGCNGCTSDPQLGIEPNPNPRASNYVGGIYLRKLVSFLPENEGKSISEYDYSGIDDFYDNLHDTEFLSQFTYGAEDYINRAPHVKYVISTDKTGLQGAGYYDMDITYKSAVIGTQGQGTTDGTGNVSANVKTEYETSYFTIVVIDENNFAKTYKRYFNENRASSCTSYHEYFDLTANLSIYLTEGTNTVYIIPPTSLSFYGIEESKLWRDRTNWFDIANIRIGLGDDYTTVSHLTTSGKDSNGHNIPNNYNLTDTIVEGESWDALQNYPSMASNPTLLDQLQFNEYRNFAYQYVRKLIQDLESQDTGDLTGEDTADWDAANALSTLIKNLTYNNAVSLGASEAAAYNGSTDWMRYINMLFVSKLSDISGLQYYDIKGNETDDITKADLEQTILHKRVLEFEEYKAEMLQKALDNNNTNFTDKITGGGYSCTLVQEYVAERIPLFFDAVTYTNGRKSYLRVTWYIEDMYNKAVEWTNYVYTNVVEYKELKWKLISQSNREYIKDYELQNDLMFGSTNYTKYKNHVPVTTVEAVALYYKNLIEAEHYDFETLDEFKADKGAKTALADLKTRCDDQLTTSKATVQELYNKILTESKGRVEAMYQQTRLWVQYEVEKDYNDASDEDLIYVNVFFEVDASSGASGTHAVTGENSYGATNNYTNKQVSYSFGSGTEKQTMTAKWGFFIYIPGWGFGTINETMQFMPGEEASNLITSYSYTTYDANGNKIDADPLKPQDYDRDDGQDYYGAGSHFVMLSLSFPKYYASKDDDIDFYVIGFVSEGDELFTTNGIKLNFKDHYAA